MKSHFISRLRSRTLPDDAGPALLADALSEPKSFPARQLICCGDSGVTGYPVILSGWAARCQFVLGGGRQITGLLVPGDFAYLGRQPGQMIDEEIVALSSCKVAWLPALQVEELAATHPACDIALRSYAALEYATAVSWLVNVGRRDAFERMAHFICEMHFRLSHVGLVQGSAFDFPLKQHELADVLGLAPVHVNRKVQQFRQEGLVEFKSRQLEILDLARLRTIAGFQSAYLGDHSSIDISDAIA
jgi:CRP-like cAMP-binding protein